MKLILQVQRASSPPAIRRRVFIIKRRARQAKLYPDICWHTFRATSITAYLQNGGALEHAQRIAAHESPTTTKLYDFEGIVL